jgi:hypothetical protein
MDLFYSLLLSENSWQVKTNLSELNCQRYLYCYISHISQTALNTYLWQFIYLSGKDPEHLNQKHG